MPFSSRHFRECFEVGAKKFGWDKRTPGIGSMRRDGKILGWGLAGASWVALRLPCTATVEFHANGRVSVRCGTQDIGTGTYTIFAQVVHEKTGVPLDRIDVDSRRQSLSRGAHVRRLDGDWLGAECHRRGARPSAIKKMTALATGTEGSPLKGAKPEDLVFADGRIRKKDQSAGGDPSLPTFCTWLASTD